MLHSDEAMPVKLDTEARGGGNKKGCWNLLCNKLGMGTCSQSRDGFHHKIEWSACFTPEKESKLWRPYSVVKLTDGGGKATMVDNKGVYPSRQRK